MKCYRSVTLWTIGKLKIIEIHFFFQFCYNFILILYYYWGSIDQGSMFCALPSFPCIVSLSLVLSGLDLLSGPLRSLSGPLRSSPILPVLFGDSPVRLRSTLENSKWRTSEVLGDQDLEAITLDHDFLRLKQGLALGLFVHLLLL